MTGTEKRWYCEECDLVSADSEVLTAPDPFTMGWKLFACPKCREVNRLRRACDVAGCPRESTQGTPTAEGYMWTCYDHRPTE